MVTFIIITCAVAVIAALAGWFFGKKSAAPELVQLKTNLDNALRQAEAELIKLEDTLFDENIEAKLQEKATEIEASLNAAKDGFFAEFENAHAEDIKAVEEALLAKKQQLKSEIESAA